MFVIGSFVKSSSWSRHAHRPCGPVQFGDPVDSSLNWNQPGAEEISNFERQLADAKQMLHDLPDQHTELVPVYFPARLTQATNLAQSTSNDFQIFEAYQENLIGNGAALLLRERRRAGQLTPTALTTFGTPGSPDGQPIPHAPKWLDFAQFALNPYFTGLFVDDDRISVHNGRIDIAMRCGPSIRSRAGEVISHESFVPGTDRVYSYQRLPGLDIITSLVGPMFFTSPPCKQVSIGI
jgi:hypothetical protein